MNDEKQIKTVRGERRTRRGSTELVLILMLLLGGCTEAGMEGRTNTGHLTTKHSVRDIARHPAFRGFGELLLPWEENYDTRL